MVERGRARERRGCIGLLDVAAWEHMCGGADWREELTRADDPAALDMMRMRTGRPLGSDSFMSKLESTLGRRLRALPVGRPRKRVAEKLKRKGSNR